jgi:multidrug transporter EmrE-like cation transporter
MIWIAASASLNITATVLLRVATTLGPSKLWSIDNYWLLYVGFALVSYGGAFAAYFIAMSHLPVALVYISIVGITTVGILSISWLVWGEAFRIGQFTGLAIVLIGLVVVYTS